jgi:hypothetical protein
MIFRKLSGAIALALSVVAAAQAQEVPVKALGRFDGWR